MRALSLVALAALAACAPARWFHHGPTPNETVEAQYTEAVTELMQPDSLIVLDSAIAHLDAYLAYTGWVRHRDEAAVLRRLTGNAQRLAKVEAALREERATSSDKPRGDTSARSDDETVKEVQRLREELAKANEELERIKKRLATPKP